MKKTLLIAVISVMSLILISYFSRNAIGDKCFSLQKDQKPSCWQDEFKNTLKKGGVEKAFDLLNFLYKNDPDFPGTCHDYTHLIGEDAYRRFSKKENFNLSESSSYCGYGFYHGFIISLFKSGKGKSEAAEFCKYADSLLSKGTKTVILDCFHGMGHGATDFNLEQINSFADLNIIVDNSLKLCSEVAENEEQKNRCVDGVYHSVLDSSVSNQKIVSIFEEEGPFSFCKSQKLENQESCYGSLGFLVMYLNNNDFNKSLRSASTNLNGRYASLLIRQMAGFEAYRKVEDDNALKRDVLDCKSLNSDLKIDCMRGLIEGITDFGKPGEEEVGVVKFCNNKSLNENEKDFCFKHAVEYFGVYFGEEKKQKLCTLVDKVYCD